EQAIATVLTGEQQEFRFDFSTPADLPPADEANPDGPNAEMVVQQNGATVDGYTLCLDDVSLVGGAEPEPYTPDTGPRVRVNHVGYFTNGPKEATLVTDVVTATEWMLLDASDAPVATGVTTPAGLDDSAGLNVHTIDFGDVTQVGDDFVLIADGERSHPFEIGVDDVYERLRHDALNYYYPARSGIEIDGAIAGEAYARPAGHIGSAADETSPNQGDLDVGCQSIANQTNDAGEFYYGSEWACPEGYTLDVVGGWYDAGDHGKYVVNGGISVAQVMSVVERSKTAATTTPEAIADGTLAVPETGNGVPDALDEARWELEWMMTMQVPAGSGAQLIDGQWIEVDGMVHHKVHDEGWTGLPLMPHLDPQARSLHRPSTAATLNFAAVAAQGARLWAPYDAEFAADLLDRGRVAYDAAVTHPAVFATEADGAEGGGPYDDDEVVDEFYWAAAELFITTGDDRYGDDLDASPLHTAPLLPDAGGFGWGDVAALGKMNLATIPNGLGDRAALRQQVLDAADELLGIQDGEAFGHPYAGDADGEYVWGSNSQVLNNSVVLAVAFDLAADERYRDGVMEAMDYLLGRNALGWSYLTGYGEEGYNSVNQHSRWWSAQLDPALPNPPPGTISGGPNSIAELWDPVAQSLFARQGCAPQQCYVDDIGSWSTNELTINWNAPMAWVANFLADQDDGAPVEEATCRAHVREVLAFEDVAVLRVRVRSDERFGLWTLGWSFLGGEVVDWATGATVAQQGADVELSGVPSWWQHRRRSITTYVFVDRSNIAIGTPERIVLNGAACSVTIGGTGSRW
ncbi:MAG: glycoside hydrolase family 9 protein, partial [Actinomycetota bacterium]